MSLRVAVVTAALLLSPLDRCQRPSIASKPDAAAPARPKSTLPPPHAGPCVTDDDCKLYLEPCSCSCLAHVGEAPKIPDDKWPTACSGSPPGNCGAASPCANAVTSCNPESKKCVVIQ